MNKLFTKISALVLGLTMAVGVGVAVGSNREATPVHAAEGSTLYTGTFTKLTAYSYTTNKALTITNNNISGSFTISSSQENSNIFYLGCNSNNAARGVLAGTSNNNPSYNNTTWTDIITGVKAQSTRYNSNYSSDHAYAMMMNNSFSTVGEITISWSGGGNTASLYLFAYYNSQWNLLKKTDGQSFATSTAGSFSYTNTAQGGVSFSKLCFVVRPGASASTNATSKTYKITTWVIKEGKSAPASTPLTGITLGGAASQNALSIGSSDLTAKTVTVTLNPNNATDQTVNIVHESGTSGLFTVSTSAECTSGSGSFTVTGKGNTSGSETFRISGNTETSVYVDLVVTAVDDSATYWTVSFDVDGGSASISNMNVEDGNTFEFPSPGTKDHYSFDGWSSDGGNTLYDVGDTSPAVDDDIEYTAYWTEDSKYTVTYVHGDHGTGDNYVVNNVYGGSYTLATFATAGFTASSGYSFKKWSVGGVEYAEGATVTISGATTVTAVYKTVDEYTLYTITTGNIVDGDYVIFDATAGVALKNELASNTNYIGYDSTVTPVSDKITDPDASLIWHIAKSGDYWTVYNTSADKYAASTGAKNKGQLLNDGTDDKSLWTISGTSTFEFVNKANTANSVNANLRYNSGYGFACYSTSTGHAITLYKAPSNELSSITISGQTTSFASGNTFSFGGTVTAHYTIASDATVTSSATFHLDSASGSSMSGVSLTHASHDGHTIYVKYTENNVTKTATYTITVSNAPVSSLTIASNTGKVALNEYFDMSEIGVTILPADAVQTYEWTVLSNTVNDDYEFDADIVAAKNTAGTITLKCTSTADSTKYQTFVLTVSGNPIVTLPESVTLYTGKTTTVTASVEGGTSPYSYSWSITSGGSYASISSGGSSATVTLSGTAAGSVTLQCTVTDSNSKSDSTSVTFSVTASAVTSVSWSASAFDVFSGATIPTNIDDTWEVNYEKNNGDADYLTFGDYELYLGSKEITSLPYTFVAEDDGEELHVEYGGVSSSSVAVAVTQRINDVMASSTSSWDYTFTSKQWDEAGSVTLDGKSWTMSGTDDGSPYYGWDNTKGQQFGSGSHPFSGVSLQSSAFSGTVDSVTVYTSGASSINATVQVSVGGTAYGSAQTITNANAPYTFDLGGKSGTISIDWVNSSSKAIYIKEIVVNTASGSSNIANSDDHKAAQRVAVKFANAFNAAMATTANCTTGLSSAWSTCSSAYTTFLSEAAALGETEEAYAKNLIKYATRQYSDDSGEACIERMMKTYEVCVQKYGQTAFMSDLVSLGANPSTSNPIFFMNGSSNTSSMIIVIIAIVSLSALGGYFYIRRRREH